MKMLISLLFAVSLIFTLTGCDWVRSTLGMPTSDDLKEFRQLAEDTQEVKPETPAPDSIAQDTIVPVQNIQKKEYAETAVPVDGMRFFVIAGSFEEEKNAEKMAAYLSESGYKPIRLIFRNGFNVVASSGHKEMGEAYASLRNLLELDFSPEDIWIYDALKQKLHTEIK